MLVFVGFVVVEHLLDILRYITHVGYYPSRLVPLRYASPHPRVAHGVDYVLPLEGTGVDGHFTDNALHVRLNS